MKVGDKIKAIMPNGEIEHGVVIKKSDSKRLWLDEGNGHIYAINGGFVTGTVFEREEEE